VTFLGWADSAKDAAQPTTGIIMGKNIRPVAKSPKSAEQKQPSRRANKQSKSS
jgi:hypothetical protein